MYLYHTKIGIKFINWASKKFGKILKPLQYISVIVGYVLMILIVYFLVKFAIFYLSSPSAARILKVPVLMPLIPYLPELFKIDFLPPFYFAYWIIIIAIIAIPHEFAHGIFARLNKIKINTTGFGFLGPFLAAFVNPNEKQMTKSSKFSQLSVLAGGTFANVIMTILFLLVLWGFFALAFSPAGAMFNIYATSMANTSDITSINGILFTNPNQISQFSNSTFINLTINNQTFFTDPKILQQTFQNNISKIVVFDDSPAFNAQLKGAIAQINGKKIPNQVQLRAEILSKKPGDIIIITTIDSNKIVNNYTIKLAERNGKPFLGIGVIPASGSGFTGWIYSVITKIKDPAIYYQSSIGDLGIFIFDLLWWIVLINISVALVNMVPVGLFDGGRFFMLTLWGITRNEKFAQRAFSVSTWFFILLVIFMMIRWVLAFT